jgi:hypothetical protein
VFRPNARVVCQSERDRLLRRRAIEEAMTRSISLKATAQSPLLSSNCAIRRWIQTSVGIAGSLSSNSIAWVARRTRRSITGRSAA